MYPDPCAELQHYSAAGQVRLQRNQCSEAKHFIAVGIVVIFYCLGCHLGQLFWHRLMWVNHGYWGRDRVCINYCHQLGEGKKSIGTSDHFIFSLEMDWQEVLVMI